MAATAARENNDADLGKTDDKGNLSGDISQDKVDLNSATLDQIKAIPQMGNKRAQTIFDWRATHGKFAKIDDLDKVPGIGRAFVEMVRMYATVK